MQSIIALAGVVGLVAAALPAYGPDSLTTIVQSTVAPTPYATSETLAASFPAYYPIDNASTQLQWSSTQFIRTSAFTTFCPEATTLTFNTRTLTVTAPTTLTVTDCYNGCEIVRPLPTTTVERTTAVVSTTFFETFCPEPTTLTFSTRTFTITEATTLTIPQKITTTTVFKTVIPFRPTKKIPVYPTKPTKKIPVYPTKPTQTIVIPTQPTQTPISTPTVIIVPTLPTEIPGSIPTVIPQPTTTPSSIPIVIPTIPVVIPTGIPTGTPSEIPGFDPEATEFPSFSLPLTTVRVFTTSRTPVSPELTTLSLATTATLDTIIPPYPTFPAVTTLPAGTGTSRIFATAPAYTGAANRVGAGAFMAVAGFAALL